MPCPCPQQECSLRFTQCISILFVVLLIKIMCKIFGENELQETCLASKEAMPFGLLKKKLFSRLQTMGIRIIKTYEEVNICGQTLMLIILI